MNRTWTERFWLPEGLTWADLEDVQGCNYHVKDFVAWSIWTGVVLLFVRNCVVVPLILRPTGLHFKIRSKHYQPPQHNDQLEVLYKINRARPPRIMFEETTRRIGWTERKVERWLRRKVLSTQMTTLEKFTDCGWQALFYGSFTIFGLFSVVPKDFFWEPEKGWESYPFYNVTSDLWWYCVIDCGFYVAQTITLFTQDRRHDFYQMLSHHVACLLVGVSCMTLRAVPLMALGIFLHEVGDIPLCLAKMFQYAGKNNYSDAFAGIFAVLWVSSRIIAYPLRVLFPVYKVTSIIGADMWVGMFWSQLCSTVFLLLNLLWTYEIFQSIKRKFATSTYMTDGRSSQEELSDSETPEPVQKFVQKQVTLIKRVSGKESIPSRGW